MSLTDDILMHYGRAQAKQLRQLLLKQTDSLPDGEIVKAPTFVEKWKAGVSYEVGKRLNCNGTIYKVIQSHTSQEDQLLDQTGSLYAKVLIPDPGEIPEWEQPESTNPYMTGDKVRHQYKIWVSDVDDNVWEPGVYGWHTVEE